MAFVYVLQHHAAETSGTLGRVLQARSIETHTVAAFAGESVPAQMGEAAGLVVLGGPMGALEQEQYPFLADETALIRDALAQNLPILGICLGAQLLAHALGSAVTKAPHAEIGWHLLHLTEAARRDPLWAAIPSPCSAFHWHEDRFSLPPGADALASSALTPCQAFRFGTHAYGLQCHLEMDAALVQDWLTLWGGSLPAAGESAESILAQSRHLLPGLEQTARAVFGAWADLLPAP